MRLGLSQNALAKACGVSGVTQGHYELGRRAPDAIYLASLAGLGGDVAFVVTGVTSRPLDPDEAAFLTRFRAATAPVRAGVIALLSTVDVAASRDAASSPAIPKATAGRTVHFHGDANATNVVNGDQHIAGDQVVGGAGLPRPRPQAKPRKSR